MSAYFSQYLSTYQRVLMGEMLECEAINARKTKARASLVVNPLTGMPYSVIELSKSDPANTEQCVVRFGALCAR
jgi:hypothetical protein